MRKLILIGILFDPALDICLTGPCHGQCPGRYIFCNGGAGGCEGSLSYVHRCYQICIAADKGMVIYFAAMLFLSVEIDSHCTAAEIYILSKIRIAAVNEVRQLRAIIYGGILHFYEIADFDVVMEHGIRAEMDERPDFIEISDAAFMGVYPVQVCPLSHCYVSELGIGTDDAVSANHRLTPVSYTHLTLPTICSV